MLRSRPAAATSPATDEAPEHPANHRSPSKRPQPQSGRTPAHHIGAAPRYLLSHRGVLYFRARVPEELQSCLGRREIRRSLGTSSLREARPKATSLASALFHIYDLARDTLMARQQKTPTTTATTTTTPLPSSLTSMSSDDKHPTPQGKPLTSLTDDDLRGIMGEWLAEALEATYERRLVRRQFQETLEEEREQASFLMSDAYEELETLNFSKTTKSITAAILRDDGYDASQDDHSLPFLKACHIQKIAETAYLEQVASPHFTGTLVDSSWWPPAAAAGSLRTAQQVPTTAAPMPVEPISTANSPLLPQTKPESTTLAQAVESFIDEKNQMKAWKSSAQKNIPQRLKLMVDILDGQTLPMSQFDRSRIKELRIALARLPKNMSKYPHLKDKPIKEVLALDLPDEQRVNVTTRHNYCVTIKSFIKWAWKEDLLPTSAGKLNDALFVVNANGERVADDFNAVAQARRYFTIDELKHIFGSQEYREDQHTKGWQHWLPLLGLYTGARIEELCQLYLDDIQAHPDTAEGETIWVLNIHEDKARGQKVKTRAGNRLVPLHPFLAHDLGFLRFVERLKAAGEVRLFPDLSVKSTSGKSSDAASKWFTRFRRKCNVGEGADTRSSLTFHSFRHTLATFCKEHRLSREVVKEVIGHTDPADQTDITVRYEGKFSPAVLFNEITKHINWHEQLGLDVIQGSKWGR